jgi:hypothetical protein
MRRATAEFLDRGLSVLYVAFGMLHWKDVDDTAMVSPLLLVPVALLPEGPKGTPTLGSGDDDIVMNPALALRLRDFNVVLPTMEELDGLNISQVLAAVHEKLEEFEDWRVEPTMVLSSFSFAKEAMFRDLQDNKDAILAHPIVRALATSDPTKQSAEFIFDPIDPQDVDRVAPPEDTPLVLDADSSQRAAIAAALAGKTFVMDGPPGTGKSQTIANMIGALLYAGKSVLFVSEKAAALDVVRNRLADAGLENFLLELHSHKASRKEVAAALLRSLDNESVAPRGMNGLNRAAVVEHRNQLNDYAEAMNEVREPLMLSLHFVLGLLSKLEHVPSAPIPETAPGGLSDADYRAFQEITARLERAWRPAAQGASYLWRDVIDDSSLDIRLYQAGSALEQLAGTVNLNRHVMVAFDLLKPSSTGRLSELLDHQHAGRPEGVLEQWLTTDDLNPIVAGAQRLANQIEELRSAESAVVALCGRPWTSLPDLALLSQNPGPIQDAANPIDMAGLTAATMNEIALRFENESAMLEDRLAALRKLGSSLGLTTVKTFGDADRVMRLVDFASAVNRPERRWLDPAGLARARADALELRNRLHGLVEAEERAATAFTADALKAPLSELQDRFIHLHKGLKKLSGDYRTDKKSIAALLTDATNVKQGIQHLTDAIAWSDQAKVYNDAVAARSASLGAYWAGRDTDFTALAAGLDTAEDILALCGAAGAPAELASFLTEPESARGQIEAVASIRGDVTAWKQSLAPAPSHQGRPELVLGSIAAAAFWLRAHLDPLRRGSARVAAVDGALDRIHTQADAEAALTLAASVRTAHQAIRDDSDRYTAELGDHFRGTETDMAQVDTGLTWAVGLRAIVLGALNAGQIKALSDSNPVAALHPALARWNDARDRILNAFDVSRRDELLRELDDYRNAPEFINELRDDTAGQDEWFAFTAAREELASQGLDAALGFCIEQRIEASQVPGVLERALLRAWAEHTIRRDKRLKPVTAKDREALVDAYRGLDKQLIVNATSDIIRSVNTRRPQRTSLGEPALIRRQGMMKRKHMPVRDLIAATRTTSLAIKPCFMMSPLAVSQYLPPDMNFDVVIFDEASQVTPGDAINCIYRGKALILAGDDKQLPPTSFFERVVDDASSEDTDVADFESVLEIAKGCGAFNNLGLKWHYRSRHEALIAFSNYKFYEGKLITYPSSHAEGDDVGVQFFNAHGTYRRGGGADNPLEAAQVAERVIEHFTKRPKLTLGVVTFSVAQADAVHAAIDKARESRRDLDKFFDSSDRLNGFFVRSLESVQGDERDVIIFSVGYGPDEVGKISTNFGVLNKPKGWRRLNVGITRARQRVEVVASMTAGDIPPSENENVGYLRAYLDYAARGQAALAVELGASGLEPESPFEESVIDAIKSWGYIVEPQVGAAGFRIDIGVRHPAHPGMFAIGIECDGYQYHSAPAARDRDRLRDQVLTGLGWTLHRIWGTAWYRNRSTEESRLKGAIQAAIDAPAKGRVRRTDGLKRPVVTTQEVDLDALPGWTTEYRTGEAMSLPYWVVPSEPGNHLHFIDPLVALVEAEGPVHIDVVCERLRDWWGIGRVSYKVRDNIDLAVRQAEGIGEADGFLDVLGRLIDRVRTPSAQVIRKSDHVHLGELRLAVTMLLREVGVTERDELVTGVARIFGWSRTGADISRRINEAVDELVRSGEVSDVDGRLAVRT